MKKDTTIIRRYAEAKLELKVDIICKYYPQIDGIVNARIAGLKYIIWEERERNKRAEYGVLGVRIQSGRDYSDPTADKACVCADLENAIRSCTFSENLLEGIEHPEKIIAEAHILREMEVVRHLYDLQIACLREEDRILYQRYLNREMTITDIASSCHICYHSAVKKISRIKKNVQCGVLEILEETSCHVGTN